MRADYWDDIRQSLFNHIDHKLLEKGAYVNVPSGYTDFRGNDLSRLFPVVDNQLYSNSGYIWQSAFHNWVYESGLASQPSPIVASGVYINGVFTPSSASLHIDYINGRIISNSSIAVDAVVQSAFSYKEYSLVRPNNSRPYANQGKFLENSITFGVPFPASPDTISLPALLVEIDNATEVPFQFGGTHSALPNFTVSIVSDNLSQVESIASVICNEATRSFPISSFGSAPKFDFYNNLTENYSYSVWASGTQNLGYIKSVNYSRVFNSSATKEDPTLFAGVITLEISAIR